MSAEIISQGLREGGKYVTPFASGSPTDSSFLISREDKESKLPVNILQDNSILIKNQSFDSEQNVNNNAFFNERWIENNIPAKIFEFNKDFVSCECLVDKENLVFENRTFPRILFNHFSHVKCDEYVLISMKSKPGSIRFDVFKGDPYFNTSLFNQSSFQANDIWKKVESSNFDDEFEFKR